MVSVRFRKDMFFLIYFSPTGLVFLCPPGPTAAWEINTQRLNIFLIVLTIDLGFLLASFPLIISPLLLICMSPRGCDLSRWCPAFLSPWRPHNNYPWSSFSLPLCSEILPNKILHAHWLKQLYSSTNKSNRQGCGEGFSYREFHHVPVSMWIP